MRKRKKIEELKAEINCCEKCRLHQTRTNALCGEGNLDARLMLIAQAPGDAEDREGRMFIGPSGKVLNELLDESGIKRDEIYMTNLVKCKLPKNRRPKQDEIEACSSFLDQEIILVNPSLIAPLGYYASLYILKKYNIPAPKPRSEFSGLLGKIFFSGSKTIVPLPHPSSLIYNRSFKPGAIAKYKTLNGLLEGSGDDRQPRQ